MFDLPGENGIDINKLSNYISFVLKVHTKKDDGSQTFIQTKFRKCKSEDFIREGIDETIANHKNELKERLCPDKESLKDLWRLKSSYTDHNRVSFVIGINQCYKEAEWNKDKVTTCKDNHAISEFLSRVYFTSYLIEEKLEFGNPLTVGKRPIHIDDNFSQ